MKKYSKWIAVLTAATMLFAAGCGSQAAESTSDAAPAAESTSDAAPAAEDTAEAEETAVDEETVEEPAADGDGYSMTFIMPTRNEFNTMMEDGMKAYSEANGIKLTSQDVNNDTSKVIQYVESAKNAGDQAVIVLPIDSETIPQIVEAAGDMKVVIVNRAPADLSIFSGDVAYVGSEENDAGNFQGEYLAQYLKDKGETVAKPIILLGTVGAENTTKRTESAKKALADAGLEVEVVAELAANWDRADALSKIQPLITTADYNCIIANNDSMALGAVEALKGANIDPSTIPVVGIDATVDGLQAVEAGEMAMTVFQDAAGQGTGAIMAAYNLLEGNSDDITAGTDYILDSSNPNVVWIPFQPVYQDNVADYK